MADNAAVVAAPVDEDGEATIADRPTELATTLGMAGHPGAASTNGLSLPGADAAGGYRPRSDSVRTMREEGLGGGGRPSCSGKPGFALDIGAGRSLVRTSEQID